MRSALDVPPEDNSEMDGYAMRAADVPAEGTVLPVIATHRGRPGRCQPLQPGSAARIFTGAQVPAGADTVVMQEQCEAIAPTRDGELGACACVNVRRVPAMAIRAARRRRACAMPWCCAAGTRA